MKKYPIVTITEALYNKAMQAMSQNECTANIIHIIFRSLNNGLFPCDIKWGYYSDEFKTADYIGRAIVNGHLERLHIVKE